jgi:hypothetical protein
MLRALLLSATLLGAVVAPIAGPAVAHHGWGNYDAEAPRTLSGTIERVQAQGPHATLWLRTGDKVWEVVLAPPSRMRNRGLPPERLAVGGTVEVFGYPHRSNGDEIRAEWIRAGGGDRVQLR